MLRKLRLKLKQKWVSYKGKCVISQGASSPIMIGYGITIIKGEYSWYTGWYSVYRNKGFNSFPWVLNIIPISFKSYFIICILTFLHKGGE